MPPIRPSPKLPLHHPKPPQGSPNVNNESQSPQAEVELSSTAGTASQEPGVSLAIVVTTTSKFSKASRKSVRSHAAAWSRRQQKEQKQKETASIGHALLALEQKELPSSRKDDPEDVDRCWECPKIQQVVPQGQATDPFNSTALRVNSDALYLVRFYRMWTTHDAEDYAQTWEDAFANDRLASSFNMIVADAMSNELHMYSLLSHAATLMEKRYMGAISSQRTTFIVRQALKALQHRLGSSNSEDAATLLDLLYDTANLGIAAMHRGEDQAALIHLRASKYLIDKLGGFQAVPPHLVPTILATDLYTSTSNLICPVFDFSAPGYQGSAPVPFTPDASLQLIGRKCRSNSCGQMLDERFENFFDDIVYVVEVLEAALTVRETAANTFWVPWKTTMMALNLLACTCEQEDLKEASLSSPRSTLVSSMLSGKKSSLNAATWEVSRLTLLLWTLWLGILALTRTTHGHHLRTFKDNTLYVPIFKSSVLTKYRASGPYELYNALAQWNAKFSALKRESKVNEDLFLFQLASVVHTLEASGDIHLGPVMLRLLGFENPHEVGNAHETEEIWRLGRVPWLQCDTPRTETVSSTEKSVAKPPESA